jgi:lipopolysaccharide export system permease protein
MATRVTVPRVLSRYAIREVLLHFLGVFAVVLAIFLVQRFGKLLSDALEGSLPADVVLYLLWLRTLVALPSLLPVAFYLAVLLALGRLHQDRETTALAACGVSPLRVPGTVLSFSILVTALIGVLALFGEPWAAARFEQVREQAMQALEIGGLMPGRFYEVGGSGEQVVFAESRAEDGSMRNVFVQDRRDGRLAIISSERAIENVDEKSGYRYLTLVDGYRYDLGPRQGAYEVTQYQRFVIRTPLQAEPLEEGRKVLSTAELMRSSSPVDAAELQWRMASPVSTLLLVLVALALSRVDPYQGKYAKFFAALLIYIVYERVLDTAKDLVRHGTLAPLPGLWSVHAMCLLIVLALLAYQARGGSLWSLNVARTRRGRRPLPGARRGVAP